MSPMAEARWAGSSRPLRRPGPPHEGIPLGQAHDPHAHGVAADLADIGRGDADHLAAAALAARGAAGQQHIDPALMRNEPEA